MKTTNGVKIKMYRHPIPTPRWASMRKDVNGPISRRKFYVASLLALFFSTIGL